MKRIALLICGVLLLVAHTAEAQQYTWTNGRTYVQPVRATTAAYSMRPTQPLRVAPANYSPRPVQPMRVAPTAYGTSTAQGVANIMASSNRVGHWGGNRGYEGCGSGATPGAAYNNCCYANSGMRTVDVGYARSASGMWYCCRRYR